MIKEVDQARESYHSRYAGYLPNDENHQDIMINSGLLGTSGTAELLETIIRKKAGSVKHVKYETEGSPSGFLFYNVMHQRCMM